MSRFTIIETSIDPDNYVNLVLIDQFDNVQQITIRTCDRDDDISIVDSDDPDNAFEFHVHRHTLETYNAMQS